MPVKDAAEGHKHRSQDVGAQEMDRRPRHLLLWDVRVEHNRLYPSLGILRFVSPAALPESRRARLT